LNFPEVSVALCGAKNSDQLLSLFKALENLPSIELLSEAMKLANLDQK
jgi:aryl-alcohol dehydrogenase-like predicted oxidoreductase